MPDFASYNSNTIISNEILKEQHFTKPAARYTESSLIKEMENLGIGRPSTYATILSTIKDRGYVVLEDKSVVLSELKNIVVIVKKPVLEGTLLVERNAVYTSKGKKYVLLVEDGVTKKRFVTVGPGSNSTICILDGISEGDSVVIR